jgi:endo-1,4-beta-xylanase
VETVVPLSDGHVAHGRRDPGRHAQIWGAAATVPSGASVSATNLSYNPTIGDNGGTMNFGFLANWTITNTNPTAFTLNGTAGTTA